MPRHWWWTLATPLAATAALLLACGGAANGRQLPDDAAERSDRREQGGFVFDTSDPDVQAALAAMGEGRPYVATRLLQPALRDAARRTPEVVLLAARASAEWGGWTGVRRLLTGATWLDTLAGGEGRELLARAALATSADADAVDHARRAVEHAADDSARGVRRTLEARALDRLDRLPESAAAYTAAAEQLPAVADWLRLRAAGVLADGAARQRLYADVRDPIARERIAITEAQTRRRLGDLAGAAQAYLALGDTAAALGLRLAVEDSSARPAIRVSLLDVVRRRSGTAQARIAATTLDSAFGPLPATEQLIVARSLARSGPAASAARAFARAFAGGEGTADDRLSYARQLFATRDYPAAAREFARVPASHPQGGSARYEEARAQLRAGEGAASRATLRRVIAEHPRDAGAASQALYLLADLATDEGRDAAARTAFLDLVREYPTSSLAPTARFQAALIAYLDGEFRTAARELDTLVARHRQSAEASRARYWAGRAYAAAGDTAPARARWRSVVETDERSYYATRSRERLGADRWTPPASGSTPSRPDDVGAAARRIALLRELGMDFEATLDANALLAAADSSLPRALVTGTTFIQLQQPSRAIRAGTRAQALDGEADAATFRLLYPVVHRDVLAAEARRHRLDAGLVAALIRQESNFEPGARSPADARGLMQLMPAVGQQVARGLDFPVWDVALLYQPDVNVQLGTAHLASLLRQYDAVEHVLAAYNAGGTPVGRWRQKRGAADPEVFTERISYAETRDYVRIVLRNREIYEALYEW